jgi:subtilisin family serine protease
LDAWDKGWTGKGTKILIIDSFGKNINAPRNDDSHGIYVSLLARNVAIGSEILTLDWSFPGNVFNAFGGAVTAGTLAAINMSFDLMDDTNSARNQAREIVNAVSTDDNFFIAGIAKHDAVLVKAAGNDNKPISLRGAMTAVAYALIDDASAFPKTLLVGALDKDGSVDAKANKASYSNTPGADSKFQSRFVMANGTSPFAREFGWDYKYNDGAGNGTSFAAPRVAGYIGILRHKFPNLNAEKSSSIILDTARTDTLWCHPNCESSVVGRGEASLSRALAPVGRLR